MTFARRILLLWMLGLPVMVAAQTSPPALAITTEALPEVNFRNQYRAQLLVTGGVAPYRWTVVSGALPEGIALDPDTGVLSGTAAVLGEARFTVQVTDAANPQHSVTKEFGLPVVAALVFEWSKAPQVQTNRIDGSLRVANGSRNDYDLTVVVVAVNESGRATALGYQRIKLKANTIGPEITFGTTLPRGAYVVHADANAEVPEKHLIIKERLETQGALRVVVGP